MTRIEGHPPPIHDPVIFLPPAYDGFGAPIWDACEVCDDVEGGLCATCRDDMEDTARADEARARWEES